MEIIEQMNLIKQERCKTHSSMLSKAMSSEKKVHTQEQTSNSNSVALCSALLEAPVDPVPRMPRQRIPKVPRNEAIHTPDTGVHTSDKRIP